MLHPVRPSVRLISECPFVTCLRLSRNRKAVETSYLVEALVQHRDKKIIKQESRAAARKPRDVEAILSV